MALITGFLIQLEKFKTEHLEMYPAAPSTLSLFVIIFVVLFFFPQRAYLYYYKSSAQATWCKIKCLNR